MERRDYGSAGGMFRDEPGAEVRAPLAPGVIRIPVTPLNRERLRVLRERELEPWRDAGLADGAAAAGGSYVRTPPVDREGTAILLVLAGAAAAALVQTSWAAQAFVSGWMHFREWVGYLLS